MRLTISPCPGSTLIGILNLLAEEHGLTAITVGGRRKGRIDINVDTDEVTIAPLDLSAEVTVAGDTCDTWDTGPETADPPEATVAGQPEPPAGLTAPGGEADPPCDIPGEDFPDNVTPARPVDKAARRVWTDDDKAAAVRLAGQVGPKAAADKLGCHPSMIRRWKRGGRMADPRPAPPAKPPTSPVASHAGTPHSVDQGGPGVGHATSDDPYVCTCGDDFPTSRLWAKHRNSYPETQKKHHRLEDQPTATLVPTGLPAPTNDIARARAAAYDATTDEAADG